MIGSWPVFLLGVAAAAALGVTAIFVRGLGVLFLVLGALGCLYAARMQVGRKE